jgi:hypothetical protein
MKHLLPTHAIRPHKSDYGDRCAELHLLRRSATTTLRRLVDASSPEAMVREAEAALERVRRDRDEHLRDVDSERGVYRQLMTEAKQDWARWPTAGQASPPPFTITINYM